MAYGMLLRQSTMMAFVDTFWIMGVLCLCLLPLLLLVKKVRNAKPVDPSSAMH
jgi:MFS transporter, DHA2 family, multidrug resistance protein